MHVARAALEEQIVGDKRVFQRDFAGAADGIEGFRGHVLQLRLAGAAGGIERFRGHVLQLRLAGSDADRKRFGALDRFETDAARGRFEVHAPGLHRRDPEVPRAGSDRDPIARRHAADDFSGVRRDPDVRKGKLVRNRHVARIGFDRQRFIRRDRKVHGDRLGLPLEQHQIVFPRPRIGGDDLQRPVLDGNCMPGVRPFHANDAARAVRRRPQRDIRLVGADLDGGKRFPGGIGVRFKV